MIQDELMTYLLSQTGLTALVGTRIYPFQLDENPVLPSIVYLIHQTDHVHTLTGSAGYARSMFCFRIISTVYDDCILIAEQLRNALQAYRGVLTTIRVGECYQRDQPEDFSWGAADGSQDGYINKDCYFRIGYYESQPR